MNISNIIKEEVKVILSNKHITIFSVIGPIILTLIMIAIFLKGVMTSIPIAIIDADNSAQSRELINMLRSSPALDIKYRLSSEQDAIDMVKSGKINGFIIIPENFSQDILSGKQTTIISRYNNQYMTQGSSLNKAFAEITANFSAKYNAANFLKLGVSPTEIRSYVLPVQVNNRLLFNPSINYSWFLLIGVIPALWQLFTIGVIVYILGIELNFPENITKNVDKYNFLLPIKLIPFTIFFTLQFFIILFILFTILKIPLNGSFIVFIIASILFVTATISMGALITSIIKRLTTAISAVSVYTTPAFAYAGVTFPHEAMPVFAKIWSNLLPITHYHKIIVDIAIRNTPLQYTLSSVGILLLFTALALPIASLIYEKRILQYEK